MRHAKITYDPEHDFYEILEVESNADADALQRAFRKRAKELHPDVNQERAEWAKEQFQWLNEAYSVLSEPASRHIYNNLRWPHQKFPASPTPQWQAPESVAQPAPAPAAQPARRPYRPPTPTYNMPIYEKPRQNGLWRAMADLFNSPYRYILIAVALVAVVNMAWIIYGVVSASNERKPDAERVVRLSPTRITNVIPTTTLVPTVTGSGLQQLQNDCGPHIEIKSPDYGAVISDEDFPLAIIGRISDPAMFTFEIEAIPRDSLSVPLMLRPRLDTAESPIQESALAWLDALARSGNGIYDIKITLFDAEGLVLNTCFTVVRKT